MGYLICQKCGGYYKLEESESKDDFVSCECYGSLTYVDSIDDYSKKNTKSNKDVSEVTESGVSDVEFAHNIKSDVIVLDSDLENGFEDASFKKKELLKSPSFPSFRESEESPSVKNRNYYRKISTKDIKPDIGKLKLIKDVNGVIEALNYNDLNVKLEAVQALGAMGDERALEHLDKLKNEERGILKTYAENAIFHIESKNKGLKSKNRAYYREEYYKENTRKSDENILIDQSSKHIDQTINKIKEKTSVKTSYFPNNVVSGSLNIHETKNSTIQKTTKLPGKTDGKVPGKTDKNEFNTKEVANTKEVTKFVKTPEIIKKDLPNKTTPKSDYIKKIKETKGTENEDIYFIQFLGIKKTDKPLIMFILMFTVLLVIGVILTMGYK